MKAAAGLRDAVRPGRGIVQAESVPDAPRRVAFFVPGLPRPAGSKRAFVIAPKDPSKKPRGRFAP